LDKDNHINSDEYSESVSQHFTAAGGLFLIPAARIAEKLKQIRAVVFDWDGVFNDGFKGEGLPSAFGEADSMGINMLRYGIWFKNHQLPSVAVISGQDNRTAIQFALREHFHNVYLGIIDKRLAVRHLCTIHKIKPSQIACLFDDINDLSMAKICGLRCLVNRPASPLFKRYASENKLCDYITGSSPDHHAVREIAELFLGLMGLFETVVESRVDCDQAYQDYFNQRQATLTQFYTQAANKIVPKKIP
jgi:3-deoxy-D-manno-octulosonate 8-phosphate phosphatase (KDO 8-P phosphatase)